MGQQSESKATPLGKDIRAIVVINIAAVLSAVVFAALGYGVLVAALA